MKFYLITILCALSFSLQCCTSKHAEELNEEASVENNGDLPENPLRLKSLSTFVYPSNHTMAGLYGNEQAYLWAKTNKEGRIDYPNGAVLYAVTWTAQLDEGWFGVNVPENISLIERVEFLSDGTVAYSTYDKAGIEQLIQPNKEERIQYIIAQRMAPSP